MKYCPETVKLAQIAVGCKGIGSIGLDCYSTVNSRTRASVESVLTWHLVKSLNIALNEISDKYPSAYGGIKSNSFFKSNFMQIFSDVETETLKCLARIELNGISVKKELMQKLADTLKGLCNSIEKKAFSLAGRHFNFISSTDVAKVIGKLIITTVRDMI